MNLKELDKRLRRNKKYRDFSDNPDLAFQIARVVIDSRIKSGLTQNQLAKKVGTKQSSISRLEDGARFPSLRFLSKVLKALGVKLTIKVYKV